MGLLNDRQIRARVAHQSMITPFEPTKVRGAARELMSLTVTDRVISYGLSSFGYDFRLGFHFKIPSPIYPGCIDPKEPDTAAWLEMTVSDNSPFVLPPNSFALAESVEIFKIPRDVMGLVLGKSTYARSGIVANFTPLEPGWRGRITIELGNLTPLPVLIYPGEGIAQALFYEGEAPDQPYGEGLYQDQGGIVHSKV